MKLMINGKEYQDINLDNTEVISQNDSEITIKSNGELFSFAHSGEHWQLKSSGQDFWIRKSARVRGGANGAGGVSGYESPMPGKVFKILVTPGQTVEVGQVLVILEAMKMEHPLKAHAKGAVKRFNFQEGDLVDGGAAVLEFEEQES